MYLDCGGVRIYTEVVGDGDPVLLLHGFPDSGYIWREQVPALAASGWRVLVPDMRGYGRSDKPAAVDAYIIPNLIADVVALLDDLAISKAHVVGHDQGAVLGWLLAALVPDRVHRFVALSVGHPAAFFGAGFEQLQRSWYSLLFQHEHTAEAWFETNAPHLFATWGGHPACDAALAPLREPAALTAALNWYRANMRPEIWTTPIDLPPIASPTLGLWGVNDGALTEAQMKNSGHYVTGPWRYERIQDAGHWLQLDAPGRINTLLIDFLNS
jgi:pimeloyl-ACP methyl ester carboxylesterase